MNNSEYLKQLLEMSETNQKLLNTQFKIFEETFNGVVQNAPEADKPTLEKMKVLTNKAIILAKQGKQAEANEILNQIRNECKSTK